MKVLYFTKYSRKGASSRLRSYQYFPFLEQEGIQVTVKPLFDDAYLEKLYSGKKLVSEVLKAYCKRFFVLFTIFGYDKIVIEKEFFPYLPSWTERVVSFLGVNYIVDYDDAIFHNYDLHPNKWVRFFLKHKIDYVMRSAKTVIAGNDYLAERAQVAGAKKVVIIPTVIDIERYNKKEDFKQEITIIGWIGSPSTFKYVKSIFPVFEALAKKYPIEVHIVGAKENSSVSFPIKFIKWTEATEVQSIQNFDIGIMPLEDSPWEKGKCAYKLIQYMGCGISVVASPVGMNTQVVKDGINGYLAKNEKQWISVLEDMLHDKTKCRTFGFAGRQLIENEYTVHSQIPKLLEVLKTK
jgi:glycosyltransferase involved in cell wall biosynthesis